MTKVIDRMGEVNRAANGMLMKIIACRGSNDIDIQFEDGTIVYNRTYSSFKSGSIRNPNLIKKKKSNKSEKILGKETLNHHGFNMKIVNVRSSASIDVQFDDGTVVKDKTYRDFLNGSIENPNLIWSNLNVIGKKGVSKEGLSIEIFNMKPNFKVDIRFEDGTILYNRSYASFVKGRIEVPNYHSLSSKRKDYFSDKIKRAAKNVIGLSNVMHDGQVCTIIDYTGFKHITVRFDDGTILKNKSLESFKNGGIRNPNFNKHKNEIIKLDDGSEVCVVDYNNNRVSVRLNDGTVLKNLSYTLLKNGRLKSIRDIKEESRKGEIHMANCGLAIRVLNYSNNTCVTAQFEDGQIVTNVKYDNIQKGRVRHPFFTKGPQYTCDIFYDFTDLKKTFEAKGKVFYYCTDKEGVRQVLTLQKIMEKSGIKAVF